MSTTVIQKNTDDATADRTKAEELASSLDKLAAFVRANPDIASDMASTVKRFLVYILAADPRPVMAEWARRGKASGARVEKSFDEQWGAVTLHFGLVDLHIYSDRDAVCTRVVVGTREVEVEEPDPEALAAVPTVTRTVTVEDVQWQCHPLLADAERASAVAS